MDTKKCPFCGKKNYIDMKFCSNCGKKFEEEEEVVEETMFCPNCGTKNKVGERYCSECGFDLEKDNLENILDDRTLHFPVALCIHQRL